VTAAEAMRRRRSRSKVDDTAPTHDELVAFVEAAGGVADHSGLRPWRVLEIRGDARDLVGASLADAAGVDGDAREKQIRKASRAPLLVAVVVSPKPSVKGPHWEQESVASGVAHALSLVLDEAGWGVMWRTGVLTRHEAVRRAHRLADGEELMGWLYVGGRVDTEREPRRPIDAARLVDVL
jgi:nitroreductase